MTGRSVFDRCGPYEVPLLSMQSLAQTFRSSLFDSFGEISTSNRAPSNWFFR
jgi:hypothetical protein